MRVKEGNACRVVTGYLPLDVAVIRVSSPASKLLPGESAQMLPPAGLAPVSILLGGAGMLEKVPVVVPERGSPVLCSCGRRDRTGMVW